MSESETYRHPLEGTERQPLRCGHCGYEVKVYYRGEEVAAICDCGTPMGEVDDDE